MAKTANVHALRARCTQSAAGSELAARAPPGVQLGAAGLRVVAWVRPHGLAPPTHLEA